MGGGFRTALSMGGLELGGFGTGLRVCVCVCVCVGGGGGGGLELP